MRGDTPDEDWSALLRLGLIGCGQWGMNYLRVFSQFEDCAITMVCDPIAERRKAAEHVVKRATTVASPSSVYESTDVDAVVIAAPAAKHYDLVQASLTAGKDCLVEKPLTADVAQARALAASARQGSRVLMVGHVFRYNNAINYIRDQITSDEVGKVQCISFTRTNLGPVRQDVNALWDLVTHDVAILFHFIGQAPEWISAQGACFLDSSREDVVFLTAGMPTGLVANIRASWLDPRKVREITVVGTRKMIVFDDVNVSEPVRVYDKGALREPDYGNFGEFKFAVRNGPVTIPHIPPAEPLRNQCRHFLDCVHSRAVPLSDAEDGLRVVEVLAAAEESMKAQGAPVRLGGEVVGTR